MNKGKQYALIALSVVIGFLLIWKIFDEIPIRDVIDAFKTATLQATLGFLIVSLLVMTLNAYRWKVIIQATEKKVPFWLVFQYKIVGFGISFLTPMAKVGGEPLRAALLQRHNIDFKRGLSTVVIDKIIELSTFGILFSMAVVIAVGTYALPKDMFILLISISVVFICAIAYFYYQILNDKNIILRVFKVLRLNKIKKLKGAEKSIIEFEKTLVSFHKNEKKAFNKALSITVVSWIIMFAEFQTALMMFGYTLNFQGLFLVITTMGAAYLFPVPLALGILEAGQISMFKLLGLNTAAGVGLAMIIRSRDLLWTLIGVILLFYFGFNFKTAYKRSIDEGKLKVVK